jgi:hypothetical protein
MDKASSLKLKTLEYALKTLDEPDRIHRGKRLIKIASIIAMAALLIGPVLYFRDLGHARYVIAFCSAIGGGIGFWGSVNEAASEQIEYLNDFIDFEKIRLTIDRTAA